MITSFGRSMIVAIGVGVLLLSSACSGVQPVVESPATVVSSVDSEEDISQAAPSLLRYRGPAEMGSPDTTQCAGFRIDGGTLTIETCDGTERNETMGDRLSAQWNALRGRFASFTYDTPTESLVFEGSGDEVTEQWQRALLSWARGRYAELSTGRTSATINTALSWTIGQDTTQKNFCKHLTVLDYGYAYAEEVLCEGSDLVSVAEDWLTSEELTALDEWLYARAPLYVNRNYIDGRGEQEMSATEVDEVGPWAADLWSRIRESAAVIPAVTLGGCPEARDELAMVRDYRNGFCLLAPSTYTVFEPNPDEVMIAQESLLNVTEPRVYITVGAARGRDVDAIADEIVSTFPGFDISRTSKMISGNQAVVLDDVPGQDLNRRVLIVDGDRLYDLTFAPLDHPEMANFYASVIGDLVLMEPE